MKNVLLASAFVASFGAPAVAASSTQTRNEQLSEVVFQNYPARALAAGEQGPVYFVVSLDDKASPTSCSVTHGSGYPLLDSETCDLIVQHATFKSVLGPNGKPTKSTHEGVVNWRIPGTPAPQINPVALTQKAAPEAQICKRSQKTGSLAGFERKCMTAAQWTEQMKQSQGYWSELQGRRGSSREDGGSTMGTTPFGGPPPVLPGQRQ